MLSRLHRILHGHWALWERYNYDFLTWQERCVLCTRGADR